MMNDHQDGRLHRVDRPARRVRSVLLFSALLLAVAVVAMLVRPDRPESDSPGKVRAAAASTAAPNQGPPSGDSSETAEPATLAVAPARPSDADSAPDTVGGASSAAEPPSPDIQNAPALPSSPDAKIPPNQDTLARGELFPVLDRTTAAPDLKDLSQRLHALPGRPFQLSQREMMGVQCGVLEGAAQLPDPIPPGKTLRVTLAEFNQLRITLANGDHGVMLHFLEHAQQTWAVYRVEPSSLSGEFEPVALAGTDEERFWRTTPSPPVTLDLRYESGEVIVSRGDQLIVSAPLAQRPAWLRFEGHGIFRQLEWLPIPPLPAAGPKPPPAIRLPRMAETDTLLGDLPGGAELVHRDDGALELRAQSNARAAWVAWPTTESGVQEVVFELDRATPGTAVYLGDTTGQPKYQLACLRDRRSGRLVLGPLHPGELRTEVEYDPVHQVVPWVQGRFWVRLLFGCGQFKSWLSCDGVHWARATPPWTHQAGDWHTVGVMCSAGDQSQPPRSLGWRSTEVRPLAGINACAEPRLLASAVPAASATDLETWLRAVDSQRPSGIAQADWRRACAVRCLACGSNDVLGAALIEQLTAQTLAEQRAHADPLSLLNDAAQLLPTWDDAGAAQRVFARYETWGRQRHDHGEQQPFSKVTEAQRAAPLWTPHRFEFQSPALLRTEILELVTAERWADLHTLAVHQRFWRRPAWGQRAEPALIDWADALAIRMLPHGQHMPAAQRDDWHPPVVVEPNKRAYDFWSEFSRLLKQDDDDGACELLAAAAGEQWTGLVPDSQDPQWLVSLPVALHVAQRERPALQAALAERSSAAGKLRLRQAMGENDAREVEAAALRWIGTEVAAEAHTWLADRASAGGDFAAAVAHYRAAADSASRELRPRLRAGLAIAAAMLGEPSDARDLTDVQWGSQSLSAADIAQILADIERASPSRGSLHALSVAAAAPPPAARTAVVRAHAEGEQGDAPGEMPAEMQQHRVDWWSRQATLDLDADRLIFSNRFQVAAFDLVQRRWLWRTGLAGDQGRTHQLGLAPMRPLLVGERIVVRRFHRTLPLLACLERSTGKVLWSAATAPDVAVVSDPFIMHGRLWAFTAARLDRTLQLSLTQFDGTSGTPIRGLPCFSLQESWWHDHVCQVQVDGDRCYVVCGGATFACDALGNLLWLRQAWRVPPLLDSAWVEQHHAPPIVAGETVLAFQPGVPVVVALEAGTGKRLWQRAAPDVRRMLGQSDGRLFLETASGVEAWNLHGGQRLWRSVQAGLLHAAFCGEPGGLVLTRATTSGNPQRTTVAMVWLSLADGRERAKDVVAEVPGDTVRFGPAAAAGDRIWGFLGRGTADQKRELVELAPPTPERAE